MSERSDVATLLRQLPAVHRIVGDGEAPELRAFPHSLVVETAQRVVERHRQRLLQEGAAADGRDSPHVPTMEECRAETAAELRRVTSPTLRQVVNATGVILHTNLGRAVLSLRARQRLFDLSGAYSNLEYSLETGERGSRYSHVRELLCRLTGAEDALVVNNNAAAVLLALSAVASGGDVIVSRGELVEIGGSFRIPDVMRQSGARLVEVGTTNKTHLRDYRDAVTEQTRALMRVHTSNYRVVGFTAAVSTEELVALGRELGIPVVEDLGSGVFVDLQEYGLPNEPTVQSVVRAGVDLVTFSGDKLLGGPQAGVILGACELVERCRRHPLTRALRVDKLTLSSLEETLLHYLRGSETLSELPTLRMLSARPDELRRRASLLLNRLSDEFHPLVELELREGESQVGGGALPLSGLSTTLVAVRPRTLSTAELERRLRSQPELPVVGRVQEDVFLMDVRTLLDGDEDRICAAFRIVLNSDGREGSR